MSFIQTTEGYLAETHEHHARIRELAVQSANGIYSDEDRMRSRRKSPAGGQGQQDRVKRQFNGMNMLTGAFANPSGGGVVPRQMFFQVGANMDQRKQVFIGTMTAQALGLAGVGGGSQSISISTPDKANSVIGVVDNAMRRVSRQRADLGAYQNRFEMAAKGGLGCRRKHAGGGVPDSRHDIASQMVDYVKNQILMQSSTAMLAQANLKTRTVLQLLA